VIHAWLSSIGKGAIEAPLARINAEFQARQHAARIGCIVARRGWTLPSGVVEDTEPFGDLALVPAHPKFLPALQYDQMVAVEPRLHFLDGVHVHNRRTVNSQEMTRIELSL